MCKAKLKLFVFFIFIEKYDNDVVIKKKVALNSLLSCKFPKVYKMTCLGNILVNKTVKVII